MLQHTSAHLGKHDLRLKRDWLLVICTFVGPNGPNFTCRKIVENKSDFFRGSSLQLGLSSAHPERLLDVYFQNSEEKRPFEPNIPPRFWHFQKRSKLTKIGKNPKKWPFFANLSVLSKNFSVRLPKNQFASHSNQKKLLFGNIENFLDFTVENGPNPKSGPLCPNLTQQIWSNGLSISEKRFSSDFRVLGIFGRKPYPNSEKN